MSSPSSSSAAAAAAASSSDTPKPFQGDDTPPVFRIDLDTPPRQRWSQVVAAYGHHWPALVAQMWEGFAGEEDEDGQPVDPAEQLEFAKQLAAGMLRAIEGLGRGDLAEELRGLSEASGVALEKLVLLHLSYESASGCTSVVARQEDGLPCLARTLDWDMPELAALTIDVEVYRGDRYLYRSTTWAGYIGVYTGMRPNGYAVAVNFRDPSTSEGLMDSGDVAWPIGLFVRSLLEDDDVGLDYSRFVDKCATVPVMSPCFIIVAGAKDGGIVLTRNEYGTEEPVALAPPGDDGDDNDDEQPADGGIMSAIGRLWSSWWNGKGKKRKPRSKKRGRRKQNKKQRRQDSDTPQLRAHLGQANLDHWITDEEHDYRDSLERTLLIDEWLADTPQTTEARLWELLRAYPIWDEDTVYATVMTPGTGTFKSIYPKPAAAPNQADDDGDVHM